MKSVVLLFTLLFFSSLSSAKEEKPLRPLDPAYMGVHKMALVSKSSTIYAVNLASYQKPYDVQLLYKLGSIDLALLQTVRDGQLTTIKTKPFNLDQLMRGDEVTVFADVYSGHFERDGMLVYENIPLKFNKQLYVRKFDDIKPSSRKQEYDVVSLKKNYKIYVHRIQQAPSYAQLMHIDVEAGCLAKFSTSSAVPKETETQFKFMNCGSMKPLYFETQKYQ
jgi:hypothetical protein